MNDSNAILYPCLQPSNSNKFCYYGVFTLPSGVFTLPSEVFTLPSEVLRSIYST